LAQPAAVRAPAPRTPLAPGSTGLPVTPPVVPAPVTPAPAPPSSTGPSPSPPPPPARLQVTGREYSLTLSHPQIASGAAIVEFVDSGEDPHNLHIRPAGGGADVGAFSTALPGSHTDQSFTLAPGTYTLYCALPGHEAAGMEATLVVGP